MTKHMGILKNEIEQLKSTFVFLAWNTTCYPFNTLIHWGFSIPFTRFYILWSVESLAR